MSTGSDSPPSHRRALRRLHPGGVDDRRLTTLPLLVDRWGVARGELLGGDATSDLIAELRTNVQRELLTTHPGNGVPREALRDAVAEDLALLGRGVEVRSLFQATAVRNVATRGYLEEVVAAGGRVRIRPTLPFSMVVADGALAVCSTEGAGGGAVVVRGAALVRLLRVVFEFCWADATPMTNARTGDELGAEQRLMLRMMARGLTDQAIARQLGIAPRTLTRKLRGLLRQLGIDTRFQAGVEAARRGLV